MKKAVLFFAIVLLSLQSCSEEPRQKAIKLIEQTSNIYKENPKFIFSDTQELRQVINKEVNDVVGYTLKYSIEVSVERIDMIATFNKDISVITDNSVFVENEIPDNFELSTIEEIK